MSYCEFRQGDNSILKGSLDCQRRWKLQALRASVYRETGDCDPEYKERTDE